MSLIQRLNIIDAKLQTLANVELTKEYGMILELTGTKFYLKLNQFEKRIGVK